MITKSSLTRQINLIEKEIADIQSVISSTPKGITPMYLGEYATSRLYVAQRELSILKFKRSKI